jgi:hypothetical protein
LASSTGKLQGVKGYEKKSRMRTNKRTPEPFLVPRKSRITECLQAIKNGARNVSDFGNWEKRHDYGIPSQTEGYQAS